MELLGYFGKVPAARDFVFHGLPTRVTEAWATIMAGWMAAIRRDNEEAFQRNVLSSPVWRFLLPAGLEDETGVRTMAGLMAGSMDGAGRPFPFSILVASREATGISRPNEHLDRSLDRIEATMLAFMENQIAKDQLVETLKAAAGDPSLVARHTEKSSNVLEEIEQAACFIGAKPAWSGKRALQAVTLSPGSGIQTAGPTESYWWHDGNGPGRPSQFYVVRGLPAHATARPLFLNDWTEEWQVRRPTSEEHA